MLTCCPVLLQVYKGILSETGECVAVKVQRPGIGESIAVDMLLLRRLMRAVDNRVPQVGLASRVDGKINHRCMQSTCR